MKSLVSTKYINPIGIVRDIVVLSQFEINWRKQTFSPSVQSIYREKKYEKIKPF